MKMVKKILIFGLLGACANFSGADKEAASFSVKNNLVNDDRAVWFASHKESSLTDINGEAMKHLFFDINPKINIEKSTVRFIATTKEGAMRLNKLSLLSGQLYADKKLCTISDSWGESKQKVSSPNFTLGFVPRLFNQINKPQQIMVFGAKKYFEASKYEDSHAVRLLGGVLLQTCPSSLCVEPTDWLSSLVLIAVNPIDKKLKKVRSLNGLLKKIDWGYSKVFLENSMGKSVVGKKEYPANRVSSFINLKQTKKLLKEKSLFWGGKRIVSIKKSCNQIYAKYFKVMKKEKDFFSFMRNSHNKYSEKLSTCFRYVYPQSINESSDRFRYITYIQAYQHLHDLGYFYNCSRGGWTTNPIMNGGKRAIDTVEYRKRCIDSEIDKSMKSSVQYLETLLKKLKPSYRFITYDNESYGTHIKHYSWMNFDGKVDSCKNSDDKFYEIQQVEFFPKDIKWQSFVKKGKGKAPLIIR